MCTDAQSNDDEEEWEQEDAAYEAPAEAQESRLKQAPAATSNAKMRRMAMARGGHRRFAPPVVGQDRSIGQQPVSDENCCPRQPSQFQSA